MRRTARILVLVLTLPMILYSTGYAYAVVTTSTYVVSSTIVGIYPGDVGDHFVMCSGSDYATGGGWSIPLSGVDEASSFPISVPGGEVTGPGEIPHGWRILAFNPTAFASSFQVHVVCQAPVTVAGISVPEFGSLYIAIALGAVVYFVLARYGLRRPTLVPTRQQ